jgi:hypothetical protein
MKFLIAAAALVIAAPVAAQTAPASHAEHGGGEHEGEHKSGCCDHKTADGSAMDCCKPGADGKPAPCCDKHAEHGKGEKHGAHHG